MTIKNILVAFNGSEASVSALHYAAASVRDSGGHVTALLAHASNEIVNSHDAWVPASARKIINDANADILQQIEAHFEALRTELNLGDRLHFISAAGRVDAVISQCARSFDILVVGRYSADDSDSHVVVHPDRVALLSGRPVLVIPPKYKWDEPHAHAAVAWDGSRAAARALSDSLRMLKLQGQVSVLTVGNETLPRPIGEVIDHLQRQGVKAQHINLKQNRGIGEALVDFCADNDPCMLVMGAYEHSKFRDDFFGGMTSTVLRKIRTPLLLSH